MRDRLLQLLLERSFRTGEFRLSSGQTSRFYIDCRTTTFHPEGQFLIGRLGLDAVLRAGLIPASIGGLTMGADPVACAVAHASWVAGTPIGAFSVRKEPKLHGAARRIEGCFASGQRVVVAEDVITSGGSALRACAALEEEGGEVIGVFSVVDRQQGGREAIERAGYPVLSLFELRDLRAAAGDGAAVPDTG